MTRPLDLNFSGRRALVLHPATTVREQLVSRLEALGLDAAGQSPADPAELAGMDVLFVDVDTGHDALFPWEPGAAPLPVIGLVRSEAPGRLAWALGQGFDGYMPLAAIGNVYSTLVIAAASAEQRRLHRAREAELARRAGLRHVLVRATLHIMTRDGVGELAALKSLRALAMRERVALEDAALLVLAEGDGAGRARHGR